MPLFSSWLPDSQIFPADPDQRGLCSQVYNSVLKAKRSDLELIHPPAYVFVFTDATVLWSDAVVAWTIFYSQISGIEFSASSRKDIAKIQTLLGRLHESALAKITYFRWDESDQAYKRFDSKRASQAARRASNN